MHLRVHVAECRIRRWGLFGEMGQGRVTFWGTPGPWHFVFGSSALWFLGVQKLSIIFNHVIAPWFIFLSWNPVLWAEPTSNTKLSSLHSRCQVLCPNNIINVLTFEKKINSHELIPVSEESGLSLGNLQNMIQRYLRTHSSSFVCFGWFSVF